MLFDFDRADRIGKFYRNPKTRTFAELLIDCEVERTSGRFSSGCRVGRGELAPHGEPAPSPSS